MSMPKINVYIGWDSRFPLIFNIASYSLRKQSGIRLFDGNIRSLNLAEIKYSHNFKFNYDPKATTEFTYSRFAIPFLENYDGIHVFMDNDMLCYGDFAALMKLLFAKYGIYCDDWPAIICRKHNYAPATGTKMYGAVQEAYPRKNWSSFMIMNCSKLLCWTKAVVEQADGARLHRFADVPDEEIVDIETIEPGWNDLTHKRPETKLLHFTEGGPWFADYANCPHSEDWYKSFAEYFGYQHENAPCFRQG